MRKSKKNIAPPRLAERLLLWFLKKDLVEEVLGDLDEKFYATAQKYSASKAKRNYWYQIFNYLRPFAMKTFFNQSRFGYTFIEDWKVSTRLIVRERFYAITKTAGLALGIAAFMLALSYYRFEHSYDRFYEGSEKINRLLVQQNSLSGYTPYQFAEEINNQLPQLTDFSRLKQSTLMSVVHVANQPEKAFDIMGLGFVDSNHLDFFQRPLLRGSIERFKEQPNSIVLSQRASNLLFGEEDAIGQLVHLRDQELQLEVVGLVANNRANSSIQLDYLCNINAARGSEKLKDFFFNPMSFGFQTFVKVQEGQDFNSSAASLGDELKKYRINGLALEPLTDLHLNSATSEPFYAQRGDPQLIRWLLIIATAILLMGIVNYANLTLSLALNRTKAVGIRKILGAGRKQVFNLFSTEGLILSLCVFMLAVLLFELAQPLFSSYVSRDLMLLSYLREYSYGGALIGAILVVAISGFYPSLILSRLRALNVIKQKHRLPKLKAIHNITIVLQFSLGFVMLATTLYMNQQLHHILSLDKGANIERTLVIRNIGLGSELFKEEVKKVAGVEKVAVSTFYPGIRGFRSSKVPVKTSETGHKQDVTLVGVDADFFDLYDIEVLQNGLEPEVLFDKNSSFSLLNERARASLSLENPEGFSFESIFRGQKPWTVQGLVSDFHIGSLHQPIDPMAFVPLGKLYSSRYLSIKFTNGIEELELLADVEKAYRKVSPESPFQPVFLEAQQRILYSDESRMKNLSSILTVISLFVVFAGVLALSRSTMAFKIKQISIRKVLGASFWQLQSVQNKGLIFLLFIAHIIGIPVSFYSIGEWNTSFIYRLDISVGLFLLATVIMALCILMAVLPASVQTARSNPSDILRQE